MNKVKTSSSEGDSLISFVQANIDPGYMVVPVTELYDEIEPQVTPIKNIVDKNGRLVLSCGTYEYDKEIYLHTLRDSDVIRGEWESEITDQNRRNKGF
jgi:hypothetical protein